MGIARCASLPISWKILNLTDWLSRTKVPLAFARVQGNTWLAFEGFSCIISSTYHTFGWYHKNQDFSNTASTQVTHGALTCMSQYSQPSQLASQPVRFPILRIRLAEYRHKFNTSYHM